MVSKSRTRRICILGGSGFVGRHLASLLVRDGWSIVVPTRNRERKKHLLVLPGVDLVQADIHDQETLSRLMTGCEAVINLVGILNERGHDGSGFRRVHVELTEKVVRACHETGVPRLLHMSSLKANAERGPSHYLRTKGEGEQLVANLAGEDLKYTIFQPSVIFGPGDSFINRFARLMRLFPVLPLPRLNARFAPVYVGDVASAFALALESRETHGRAYQLCGPQIYTFKEILLFIKRQMELHRLIIGLPDFLGQAQAFTLDYLVPGKLFSLDNFRSLSVSSVCTENGLAALGIKASSMETIVPTYLSAKGHQGQLDRLRQAAGR